MGYIFVAGAGPYIFRLARPYRTVEVDLTPPCVICGQPITGPVERRPSDNALIHPAGRCPTPRKEVTR